MERFAALPQRRRNRSDFRHVVEFSLLRAARNRESKTSKYASPRASKLFPNSRRNLEASAANKAFAAFRALGSERNECAINPGNLAWNVASA
jgi:hypothetical protein